MIKHRHIGKYRTRKGVVKRRPIHPIRRIRKAKGKERNPFTFNNVKEMSPNAYIKEISKMQAEQLERGIIAEKRHDEEAALQRAGFQKIINQEKEPRSKAYYTYLQKELGIGKPSEEDWNKYTARQKRLKPIIEEL
jgi:hypothetical protein